MAHKRVLVRWAATDIAQVRHAECRFWRADIRVPVSQPHERAAAADGGANGHGGNHHRHLG
eukprot:7385127-Prymnesium_polylepis.6